MKKVLLLGSTGFIGSFLKEGLKKAGLSVAGPRVEVRDLSAIQKAIEAEKPDVVINATGKTGTPNVDWCETHAEETMSVNVGGSINVATAAAEKNLYAVQLASGCIYEGAPEGGYTEEDEPNYFGSVYSRSRLLSEKALKEFKNVLQLRIRIPILGRSHPKNLIDKLKKYPSMINRPNSCTVIEDFVPAAIEMIKRRLTGVYNMTNVGAMDHLGIMGLYQKIVDPAFVPHRMPEAEEKKLCERRSNCVLSVEKREELGIHMPPLQTSLARVLEEYRKSQSASAT